MTRSGKNIFGFVPSRLQRRFLVMITFTPATIVLLLFGVWTGRKYLAKKSRALPKVSSSSASVGSSVEDGSSASKLSNTLKTSRRSSSSVKPRLSSLRRGLKMLAMKNKRSIIRQYL